MVKKWVESENGSTHFKIILKLSIMLNIYLSSSV